MQQRPDRSEALIRRIIGGPSGAEEALAPMQMLRALGHGTRDLGVAVAESPRLKTQDARLVVRVELTEGLKAKVVEETSLSSLQLITRIVEGMG